MSMYSPLIGITDWWYDHALCPILGTLYRDFSQAILDKISNRPTLEGKTFDESDLQMFTQLLCAILLGHAAL